VEGQSDGCPAGGDLAGMRVECEGEDDHRVSIEEDLTGHAALKDAWVGQHNARPEERADGCLCHYLQAHSGGCETVRCPLAYSWGCSRAAAAAAASGSQNTIHVWSCRSAEKGGRIDERGLALRPL
jgi:hypothetical protein